MSASKKLHEQARSIQEVIKINIFSKIIYEIYKYRI